MQVVPRNPCIDTKCGVRYRTPMDIWKFGQVVEISARHRSVLMDKLSSEVDRGRVVEISKTR